MKTYLAAVVLILVFCAPSFAQGMMDGSGSSGGQQFEGFNLEGYDGEGKKSWDVTGDTADIQGNTIEIMHVDANQYGQFPTNIKAQKGVIDKVTGNMELKKDVVITSDTGSTLETDYLKWEKGKDLVSTDDYVVITDKAMTATGTGLKAQPGLKTAQMNHDVEVKVKTEPKKPDSQIVTITCDGPMEIDQKNNVATFNQNVVASQPGRTLVSDQMVVHFNQDTKQIEQAVCIGNVIITQGENVSYSDKAIYTALDQKLILSGHPRMVVDPESKMQMDK